MNRISIVLTVLNEEAGLSRLLDALFGQSRPADEVVIVDGGSTDRTVELLRARALAQPQLRFYVEPGVNIAQGRNIAIRRATGELVAVTDGGCIPDADWLAELVRPMIADPGIDACAGRILVDAATRFERYSGLLSTPDAADATQRTMFYGRSSAFRRRLWEAVGGYPDWLYTAEDTLFALRANELGFRVAQAPDARLHWRPRSTLRKTAKMFFLYGRGNGRINWGSRSGSLYWLRYHALWMASFIAGFLWPWAWLATAATFVHLYVHMITPSLRKARAASGDPWREVYVPLIVLVRNLGTNLGFLYGQFEFRRYPEFRERLARYLAAGQRCEAPQP